MKTCPFLSLAPSHFSLNPQVLENLHLPIKLASIILIKESPTQLGPQLLSNNCPISSLTSFYHRIAWAGGPQRLLSSSQDNAVLCAQPGRRGPCGDAAAWGTLGIESLPALWFLFWWFRWTVNREVHFSEVSKPENPEKPQEKERSRRWNSVSKFRDRECGVECILKSYLSASLST